VRLAMKSVVPTAARRSSTRGSTSWLPAVGLHDQRFVSVADWDTLAVRKTRPLKAMNSWGSFSVLDDVQSACRRSRAGSAPGRQIGGEEEPLLATPRLRGRRKTAWVRGHAARKRSLTRLAVGAFVAPQLPPPARNRR
jgi:hypothetical protein